MAVPVPRRHCTARRIARYGCNNFEQRLQRVLQKEASGGLQELFGGLSFLFRSNSSHIWLFPSGCEAFCCLLKSGGFAFPTVSEPSPIRVNAFLAGSPEK